MVCENLLFLKDEMNTLIFIPTYNESENVERICKQILKLNLKADLLFMDDNSPDGTGEILDRLSVTNNNIHVVHRDRKEGIGSAHIEGIRWAYQNSYKVLITMDCDFSHPPEYIKEFISNSPGFDVVVGSRFSEKDSLKGWNWYRKTMTYVGHFLTRFFLKLPYDATGAFRLYRLENIPFSVFELVHAKGYSFFFQSLHILFQNNCKIKEIPITLPARTYGESKMRFKDIKDSVITLVHTYFSSLINPELFVYSEPYDSQGKEIGFDDKQGWDEYWNLKKGTGGLLYDLIAVFYRKFIIRRTLNYFVKKHFTKGSKVLHAGCGGGQVDIDISKWINISALDISIPALNFYKKNNKNVKELIHGDLFNIPSGNGEYDGIYNLGVLEHFTHQEIEQILAELYRVVKPNGKMIIFWPPEFGLSVLFLKGVHYILNNILKKGIDLHPKEISRVKSRKQVEDIFCRANFSVIEYYFGLRDALTYSVIVLTKE